MDSTLPTTPQKKMLAIMGPPPTPALTPDKSQVIRHQPATPRTPSAPFRVKSELPSPPPTPVRIKTEPAEMARATTPAQARLTTSYRASRTPGIRAPSKSQTPSPRTVRTIRTPSVPPRRQRAPSATPRYKVPPQQSRRSVSGARKSMGPHSALHNPMSASKNATPGPSSLGRPGSERGNTVENAIDINESPPASPTMSIRSVARRMTHDHIRARVSTVGTQLDEDRLSVRSLTMDPHAPREAEREDSVVVPRRQRVHARQDPARNLRELAPHAPMGPPAPPLPKEMSESMGIAAETIRGLVLSDPLREDEAEKANQVLSDLLGLLFGVDGDASKIELRNDLMEDLVRSNLLERNAPAESRFRIADASGIALTAEPISFLVFFIFAPQIRAMISWRIKNPPGGKRAAEAETAWIKLFRDNLLFTIGGDETLSKTDFAEISKVVRGLGAVWMSKARDHVATVKLTYPNVSRDILYQWTTAIVKLCEAMVAEVWIT